VESVGDEDGDGDVCVPETDSHNGKLLKNGSRCKRKDTLSV